MIGSNLITVVGLDPSALPASRRDAFSPAALNDPISNLAERDFNLEFSGSDARYRVRVELRRSDPGRLAR